MFIFYLTSNFNAKWLHILYRANVGWDFIIICAFFVKKIETENEKFVTECAVFSPKLQVWIWEELLARALLVLRDFSLSPYAPRHATVFSYWTSMWVCILRVCDHGARRKMKASPEKGRRALEAYFWMQTLWLWPKSVAMKNYCQLLNRVSFHCLGNTMCTMYKVFCDKRCHLKKQT